MRAKITDPNGPAWTRAVLPVVALSVLAVSLLLPYAAGNVKDALFCVGGASLAILPLLRGRFRSRDAVLGVGPGFVEVREAGPLSRRIEASEVLAASTARIPGGATIAITPRGAEGAPIAIDVYSDADLEKLRSALGVGHGGAGTMVWATVPRLVDLWSRVLRGFAGIALLALVPTLFDGRGSSIATFVAAAAMIVSALVTLVAFVSKPTSGPILALTQAGVIVRGKDRREQLYPYAEIEHARVDPSGMTLELSGNRTIHVDALQGMAARLGLSEEQKEHVVRQIVSAAQRARGRGAEPVLTAAHVAELARGGEPARAWLSRLNATAERMGDGYRGPGFGEEELWSALRDPDAPVDLRAGAARVLVRIAPDAAEAGVREVLATVRDEGAKRRIAVAVEPDVDLASEELDEIDARYAQRS